MSKVLAPRKYSDELRGKSVFISASFPSEERETEYFRTAKPFEITDATIAAARAIFGAGAELVFGGHPTISPLILSVGRDFIDEFPEERRPFIHIYQSERFKSEIPAETIQFVQEGIGKIYWMPEVQGDQEKSNFQMRIAMLQSGPVAGIFIAGMGGVYKEGVEDSEFHLFRTFCKGRPIYPIGTVGGASQILLERILKHTEPMDWRFPRLRLEDLAEEKVYSVLMKKIALDIIEQFGEKAATSEA